MKFIITESQKLRLRLFRRLEEINGDIPFVMQRMSETFDICEIGIDDFIDSVISSVIDDLYYAYFSDIDDSSEEWKMVYDTTVEYILSEFTDGMNDFYNKVCKRQNMNESSMRYLRRLPIIDKLIEASLDMFYEWENPYVDVEFLIRFLSVDVTEQYFFRFHEDSDVSGDEQDEFFDFINVYLKSNWVDRIEEEIKKHKKK